MERSQPIYAVAFGKSKKASGCAQNAVRDIVNQRKRDLIARKLNALDPKMIARAVSNMRSCFHAEISET